VLNRIPSDIVFLFWRLRSKLSLRNLAEVFLIRGIVFTHEAVRDWEARLVPLLAEASPWGPGRLRPGHRFC
jgi:transposase-like protein